MARWFLIFSIVLLLCSVSVYSEEDDHDDDDDDDAPVDPKHYDESHGDTKHYDDSGEHSDDYDHEAITGTHQDMFMGKTDDERKEAFRNLIGRMDTNNDKKVSSEELEAWIGKSFKLLDEESVNTYLKEHDIDKDGHLSWTEHLQNLEIKPEDLEKAKTATDKKSKSLYNMVMDDKKRFDIADKNKDGKLDKDELDAFLHPRNHSEMMEYEKEKALHDFDKNKDSKISLEEYSKVLNITDPKEQEHFKELDLNKDGVLEDDEIKHWMVPAPEKLPKHEVEHLMKETDANKDNVLTEEEILNKQELWVGSQATDYGSHFSKKVEL